MKQEPVDMSDNELKLSKKNIRQTFDVVENYINPGYGLSLVDTLWNAI